MPGGADAEGQEQNFKDHWSKLTSFNSAPNHHKSTFNSNYRRQITYTHSSPLPSEALIKYKPR